MAFFTARAFSKITRYLPTSRTILSHNSRLFRVGGNTSNVRTIIRSLSFLCRNRDPLDVLGSYSVSSPVLSKPSCGCSLHTQGKNIGDKELVAFLDEEITNETKSYVSKVTPELDGFICKYDGADVTFTKQFNNEMITITTNVNFSVDAEPEPDETSDEKKEAPQNTQSMTARPDFTVEIAKKDTTLHFECGFAVSQDDDSPHDDAFHISEITFFEKEMEDNVYSVSGEIIDGYLYDLLMNYLDERGVTNAFVDKMEVVLTSYEHNLYVGLLENMKKFLQK